MSEARIEVHQRPDGTVEWVRLMDGTTVQYLPHRVAEIFLKDRERMGLPGWVWKMLVHMVEYEAVHDGPMYLKNEHTGVFSITPCGVTSALDYVPDAVRQAAKSTAGLT